MVQKKNHFNASKTLLEHNRMNEMCRTCSFTVNVIIKGGSFMRQIRCSALKKRVPVRRRSDAEPHADRRTPLFCVSEPDLKKKKTEPKKQQQNNPVYRWAVRCCCCCCIHSEVRFSNAAMSPELICHWCRLIQSSAVWLDVAVAWQTGSFILTLSHGLQQPHAGKTHTVTSLSLYCGPTVHSPAGRGQDSLAP